MKNELILASKPALSNSVKTNTAKTSTAQNRLQQVLAELGLGASGQTALEQRFAVY